MILDEILASTRVRVKDAKALVPASALEREIALNPREPRVMKTLTGPLHIIAEIKPASPSMGVIRENVDPNSLAEAYLSAGASVLSVLTEPHYFKGSLHFLTSLRESYPDALLLQKDFIVDEYQLLQARALSADLILLIVAALDDEALSRLHAFAKKLGLTPLVEVHDAEELKRAVDLGAELIGVNNRNLKTMKISLDVSRQLASLAPEKAFLISESGISHGREIKELMALGYRGFLVGTSLMKTPDPGEALRALLEQAK